MVEKPYGWTEASLPERACMAAALMAEYLWWHWWQSAQILFILPGEKEVYDVRNALITCEFEFAWEIFTCLGETPDHEIKAILKRLERQRFRPKRVRRFRAGHGRHV